MAQLDGITVLIFDAATIAVSIKTVLSSSAEVVEGVLDEPVRGKLVQIQNPLELSMAEVEVYGVEPAEIPSYPTSPPALSLTSTLIL